MSIASAAVNRPVIVWMRIAAFVLLGIVCFTRIPIDLLPKISLPTVNVMTQWPNVSPEEIEAQVTRPIEEALSSVQGLYQINSTTVEGVSNVRVQFNWGVDIGQAAVDTLQLVQRAQRNFPTDPTLVAPSVTKFDPSTIPVLVLGVSGIKDPVKLYTVLENQVSPIIESVNGVAAATVTGGLPRAIIVNLDPVKIKAYHISPTTVINRIIAENINAPAGVAKQSQTEYTIRALGWITSCDELSKLPVTAPNGQNVTIGDIAQVKDAYSGTTRVHAFERRHCRRHDDHPTNGRQYGRYGKRRRGKASVREKNVSRAAISHRL